jgi:hypothetical protein
LDLPRLLGGLEACRQDGMTARRTFEDYVAMDPRLGELLKEAQGMNRSKGSSFYANNVWYRAGGLRSKVKELVGYSRPQGPHELRTSAAYEACYRTIYRALVDRNQGAMTGAVTGRGRGEL